MPGFAVSLHLRFRKETREVVDGARVVGLLESCVGWWMVVLRGVGVAEVFLHADTGPDPVVFEAAREVGFRLVGEMEGEEEMKMERWRVVHKWVLGGGGKEGGRMVC